MVRQRPDQRGVLLAQRAGPADVHPHRPDDLVARDEGRHDHGPDGRATGHLIGHPDVPERGVLEVVARDADRPLRHRRAEHAAADGDRQLPHPAPVRSVREPRVVRPAEHPGLRVQEIQDRPIRAQQAGSLVHRVAQRSMGKVGGCHGAARLIGQGRRDGLGGAARLMVHGAECRGLVTVRGTGRGRFALVAPQDLRQNT